MYTMSKRSSGNEPALPHDAFALSVSFHGDIGRPGGVMAEDPSPAWS